MGVKNGLGEGVKATFEKYPKVSSFRMASLTIINLPHYAANLFSVDSGRAHLIPLEKVKWQKGGIINW